MDGWVDTVRYKLKVVRHHMARINKRSSVGYSAGDEHFAHSFRSRRSVAVSDRCIDFVVRSWIKTV
jgi:hypothetical protein